MERIGAGVIIRSNGNEDFNVMMNGIASQEWKRCTEKFAKAMESQRKEFEKEMEWMTMIKKQRDEQRVRDVKKYEAMEEPKPTIWECIKEKIAFVLACLICWDIIKYTGGKENEDIDFE